MLDHLKYRELDHQMGVYTGTLVPDICKIEFKAIQNYQSFMVPPLKYIKMRDNIVVLCDGKKSVSTGTSGWVTGLGWVEVRLGGEQRYALQ